jgi:hypothetical protein
VRDYVEESVLGDFAQQGRVALQRLAKTALEVPVDLADPALGNAEDLARLAQREVAHVQQHGDRALARREPVERVPEALDRALPHRGVLRIGGEIEARQRVEPLARAVVVADHERIQRADFASGEVLEERFSSITAPWIRVHAYCSSVAPLSGS